jgi:predicted DNA-binding protein (MmcQ/YjbR family)
MNLENLYQYCLSKNGATEHFPFDNDALVFKVGEKMFALTSLSGFENEKPTINVKCNPERALLLRAEYEDVQPGYHMSKVHWNTININRGVADTMIFELIDDSFSLVFNSLTKKKQEELNSKILSNLS